MKRSQNSELAKRINHAYVLLNNEEPQFQVVEDLMEKYGVSQIQAYRYVQQAKANDGKIAIPEDSVVFTVKLPPSLINQVKKFARFKGISISKVVRTALEEFLAKKKKQAKVSYTYDRLWEQKPSQVYHLLVPPNNIKAYTEHS